MCSQEEMRPAEAVRWLQSFLVLIREVMHGHRWLILPDLREPMPQVSALKQRDTSVPDGTAGKCLLQRFVGVRCRCKFMGTESGFTRTRRHDAVGFSIGNKRIY